MQVIATAMGFFDGQRRRAGAVFDVPDGAAASWFKPVGGEEGAPTRSAEQPIALSQLAASRAAQAASADTKPRDAQRAGRAKQTAVGDLA